MALSDSQIDRYSRQIILPKFGGFGQERLLASRLVLLAPIEHLELPLRYLAGAGIGAISIVSGSPPNKSAGFESLIEAVQKLNPGIRIKLEESAPTKPTLFLAIVADDSSSTKAKEVAARYRRVPAVAVRLDQVATVTVLPASKPCLNCCEPHALAVPTANAGHPEQPILAGTAETLKLLSGTGAQKSIAIEFSGLETRVREAVATRGCAICR